MILLLFNNNYCWLINVYFISFKEQIEGNKVKVTGYDKKVVAIGDIKEAFAAYGTVQRVFILAEGCVVTFSDKATADKVLKQKVNVSI